MRIETFTLERNQSLFENEVEVNLSESGIHPLTVGELLDGAAPETVLDERLVYPQTNGTPELRATIAALYPGATPDGIEVMNGGSEANFVSCWSLIEPGDEVVMMVPNYLQAWGLLRSFQARVHTWPLVPDEANGRWTVDLDRLEALLTPRTKILAICHPNNPTGACLTDGELDRIAELARSHGCWILSDEIYRGAELEGPESPTLWGRHDRLIVTSGLSKAYGLPGLRIGWAVTDPDTAHRLWSYHDYTTIAPGAVSDRLARIALAPERRAALLARTRAHLVENHRLLEDWLRQLPVPLVHIPPRAGAFAFLRHELPLPSEEICDRLRKEQGVLVVPGEHFHQDGYLRIGFGGRREEVEEGLGRVREGLERMV